MFKILGAKGTKFTFLIEVKEFIMPDMLDEFEGAEIVAVSFERKNKPIIYTEDRKVFFSHNDEIVAEFNCTLKAEATLFKDGRSGKYKEKLGRLSVLQRKEGAIGLRNGPEAFKTLGMAGLPLHELANPNNQANNDANAKHELSLPLHWCMSQNAVLNVVVTSFPADKDTASETSSVTDDDASITSGVSRLTGANTPVNKNVPPAIPESLNEDDDDHHSESSNNYPNNNNNTKLTAANINSLRNTSSSNNNINNSGKAGNYLPSNKTSNSNSNSTFNIHNLSQYNSPEEKKLQQTQLFHDMKTKIFDLENALLASADIVEYERLRNQELTGKASKLEEEFETFKQQILNTNNSMNKNNNLQLVTIQQLKQENESLREENRRLLDQRSVSTNNQMKLLQAELEKTKQDYQTLLSSQDTLANNLTKYNEEMTRMRNLLAKANEELDSLSEEKVKLQELLQNKQDENQVLLGEVIQAKMSIAEISGELEEAKKVIKSHRQPQQQHQQQHPAVNPNQQTPPTGNPRPRPPNFNNNPNNANNYPNNNYNNNMSSNNFSNNNSANSSIRTTSTTTSSAPPRGAVNNSNINSAASTGDASGKSVMLLGFGQSRANNTNNNSNTSTPMNPFSNLKRGFDTMGNNINNAFNGGNNTSNGNYNNEYHNNGSNYNNGNYSRSNPPQRPF